MTVVDPASAVSIHEARAITIGTIDTALTQVRMMIAACGWVDLMNAEIKLQEAHALLTNVRFPPLSPREIQR